MAIILMNYDENQYHEHDRSARALRRGSSELAFHRIKEIFIRFASFKTID